ncbi:MAG: BamA/TamA family outer membrane protein [Steroidobacteraceae bacterium]
MPHSVFSTVLRCAFAVLVACVAMPTRADIKIEIDGVDGNLRRNVLAFLSLERYKTRDRLLEDTVTRLYNRVDEEVRLALRPFGYYEPEVRTDLLPAGEDFRVRIVISPGTPVLVDDVSLVVQGPGASDPALANIAANPLLHKGEQLNHGTYEQMKGNLQRTAAAYGYLDARMLRSELLVDVAAHTAKITLAIETGERYHFGAVTIEQSVIRPALMNRFLRFKEGDPYSTVQLLRTQFALDDSLYFSSVEVQPQERNQTDRSVPVRIHAEKSRRAFSFGLGYGTDTNVRGTFGWTDSRINDRGHRFRAEVKASSITRSIDARYDIPIGDPALEKFSLDLAGTRERLPGATDTSELSLTPSVTQVLGRWQRVLSIAATHTVTEDSSTLRTSNLLVPGISYASVPEGFLGETLFSRQFFVELIGSQSVLGSNSDFVRLHVQLERVFDLWPKYHLLVRGEVGASAVQNFEDLPAIYRFYAGGDRSVRGFGYNALPRPVPVRDANGNPTYVNSDPDKAQIFEQTGARNLLVGSIEFARDLPRNFGVATFFDIGNAIDNFDDPLAYAVGIGLRYRLPVITLGLDVAQPLHEPGNPGNHGVRVHLNISPKL